MSYNCPFCALDPGRIISETELTVTIRDGFPISPGHTLVISKRHVASFFEVTETERNELMIALDAAKQKLDHERSPDSYNIGINNGPTAGQTVPHLHIHLIPRFNGDCDDPRGGVRWIFPDKADYWSKP
jgi:diadenosine tetraphosphate (Ap4A) HIT family hydrolase